ncbi:hypothetical protein [Aeromonas hydrophila]|uniref:hypothetical protein n=1 Tax=Aeromonas hydrophila TaxID=644 RepID=UPI0020A1D17B|nr:hypothetical protein [Aeromonas hydrophila]MCP1268859.1 hypothetical protein [Aeromonas hydrophila]MCP1297410.1 hypothetical protein [Aeromonas hydrophila]
MEDARDLYAKQNPVAVVPLIAVVPNATLNPVAVPVIQPAHAVGCPNSLVITIAEAVKAFVTKMELERTITKANMATRTRHLEWMVKYFDIVGVINITEASRKHVIALVATYTKRVDIRNTKYTKWSLEKVIKESIKKKAPDGEGISSQSVKQYYQ